MTPVIRSLNRDSLKRMLFRFLVTILLMSATSVLADVIWRGDFETGTTEQWKGAPKSDSIKIVTEPVREGKYALRIDGTNAARKGKLDRIEFQHQPKPPGTALEQLLRIADKLLLPGMDHLRMHAVHSCQLVDRLVALHRC